MIFAAHMVRAFTAPTAAPPAGNIAPPLREQSGSFNIAGTAQEGNIINVNSLVGYDDIFIKGNSAETAPVYIGSSLFKVYTGGIERLTVLGDDTSLGVQDTGNQKVLQIRGAGAGSAEGGELRLEMAADHDTTYDYWRIDTFGTDLRFGVGANNPATLSEYGQLSLKGSLANININGDADIYSSTIWEGGTLGPGLYLKTSGANVDQPLTIITNGTAKPAGIVRLSAQGNLGIGVITNINAVSPPEAEAKLTVNKNLSAPNVGGTNDGIATIANTIGSAIYAQQDNSTGYAGYFSGKTKISSASNISKASYKTFAWVGNQVYDPRDVTFKSDGTKMYVLGPSAQQFSFSVPLVYQYSLSAPWDFSTAPAYETSFWSTELSGVAIEALAFKSDGTKLYVLGGSNATIYQYNLSLPWDISGTETFQTKFSVVGQDSNPQGLAFKNDGTKMYVLGDTTNKIYQYSLSAPWDLSTSPVYETSFSVANQTIKPTGITSKTNGTKIYITGYDTTYFQSYIFQYNLSSAWNISTPPTYDTRFFLGGTRENISTGVAFKPNTRRMFVISTDERVTQYDIPNGGLFVDGNLGVGTEDPNTELDVIGSIAASMDLTVGGQSVCRADGTNCPSTSLWTDAGSYIYAKNAPNVVVNDIGNVGVGTSQPATLVTSALASGVGPQNGLTIGNYNLLLRAGQTYAGTKVGLSLHPGTDIQGGVNTFTAIQANRVDNFNAKLEFVTMGAGTPAIKMVIDQNGNVGISQTSPGAKLTVNNPNTSGKVGSPGDGVYVYANSTNAALSAEQANATGYAGYFSGRVAISDGTQGIGKVLTSDDAGLASWQTPVASGIGGSGTAGQVTFWTSPSLTSGDSAFFWDNTNKRLGIGTASPSFPLHVSVAGAPSGGSSTVAFLNSATNGGLRFKVNDAGDSLGLGAPHRSAIWVGQNESLAFVTNGSVAPAAMVIASSGNVGIGTASPNEKLEIAGRLLVKPTAAGAWWDAIKLDTTGLSGTFDSYATGIDFNYSGATINGSQSFVGLRVNLNGPGTIANRYPAIFLGGNVGIGTPGPTAQLAVQGDETWGTDLALDSMNITGGERYLLISTGGNATEGQGKFLIKDGSGASSGVRLTIDQNGNMGIGTVTPLQKLDVNGGIKLSATTARPTCNASARGTLWNEQGTASTEDQLYSCLKNADNTYAWYLFAKGLGSPVIDVTPSSIDLGNIIVGQTVQQQFTVTNTGGGTLLGAISGLSAPFSCITAPGSCSYSLSAGQYQIFDIQFAPTSQQTYTGTANFSGGAGVSRNLFGVGIAPALGMSSPTPGSTLSGSSVTFQWATGGKAVTTWWLYFGTTGEGSSNLLSESQGTNLSKVVSGLPTNGSTLYVRLWYRIDSWQLLDYQYTAASF